MSDVVVHGPASWNLVVDLEELPDPTPHMQFATAHRELVGGTSAGKAAHLRDLGADVVLHTVLGTDAAAGAIEEALLRAAIPTVATHVDGPTERHLNLMDRDGGRVSIYLDVPLAAELGESLERLLADVARARAVVLDLSEPSRAAIERVAALGVPLWTDLHDYDGRSSFHAPFLDAASFAFMNGDRVDSPWELLEACVTRGTEVAVCTLGAEGAIAVDAQRVRHRVAAEPVSRVVDTNGAGDGFMAGFLAAHLDGADVPGALRAGARQAARALGTVQLNPILEP
ncbi:carbohydrate kinase family protein [Nocardia sp. N13]|uniref:carbohydrate kinase family protein n=1 Tax=Nocardioides sp. N13(2025) TaxID=3453405 RepID=UPI003F75BE72